MMARVWLLRRAAMLMIRVRMVAARALLRAGAASVAAARVRLWVIAASVSQAALAANCPDGRCVRVDLVHR